MDPFFLSFACPALEERYLRHTAAMTTLRIDAFFWWWSVISRGLKLLKHGARLGPGTAWPSWLFLAWLATETALRRRLPQSRLWMWREGLVVVCRLFRTLEFGSYSKDNITILLDAANDQNPVKSAFSSMMVQGLVPMAFMGLFQPLRFRLHLPVHLLASAFFIATINLQVCKLTNTAGVAGTEWLFDALDGLAKKIVSAALGAVFREDLSWRVDFPCLQQALFLQVCIGFGAISYIVWLLERQSRVVFLKTLSAEERPMQRVWPLEPSTVFLHVMLLVVAFGICWAGFLDLAPGIIRWGLCGGSQSGRFEPALCSKLST
eukprot:evm.model.scf_12EXC.12 EVM.evm.TU.scf_12EXC.12   scf_12EXC:114135-116353(-)